MTHENLVKMHAQSPFAIDMILTAVKMQGKTCFSKVSHENLVKMHAHSPFVIGMILTAPEAPGWSVLGYFGRLWGPLGPFWAPKTTPEDPKMNLKGVPKNHKTSPKGPQNCKIGNVGSPKGPRRPFQGPKWPPRG